MARLLRINAALDRVERAALKLKGLGMNATELSQIDYWRGLWTGKDLRGARRLVLQSPATLQTKKPTFSNAGFFVFSSCENYSTRAFSNSFVTCQALVLDSGRHSSIITVSPDLNSLFGECA